MRKIGMVVAVEIKSVLNEFGSEIESLPFENFPVYRYGLGEADLFVVHSGAGQIAAAMATQFLITEFDVELVVNFGVVGGLTPAMALTKTCIVESVVHYDFDTTAVDGGEVGQYQEYPSIYIPTTKKLLTAALAARGDLKPVICASGDKFVGSKEEKEVLHRKFAADICDMEAAAVVLVCNRNQVPCLLIKTVSDSVSGGAAEFRATIDETARICLSITVSVLDKL